jgi:hypothetical protein
MRRFVSCRSSDGFLMKMPSFPTRDLKMEAVSKLAIDDWDLPTPRNASLEQVSSSFRANIARVRLLMLLPTSISGAMHITQRAQDMAETEVTGSLANKSEVSEDTVAKIEKRRIEILDAEMEALNAQLETPSNDEAATNFHIVHAHALKGLAQNPLAAMGFVELLAAHVTGTWTAIESMFGDLWETALNCHPKTLAALKGKPRRIGGSNSIGAEQRSEQGDKTVPLALIEMNNFDLRSSMGTVFRRQRRFEFTRLSSAREAYSCAFSEKSSRVDAAINNKSFDALSAVRNVLVHRAGKADVEYVKNSSHLPIPQTPLGQPVLLDGENAAALISRAITSSKSLMVAVDDWLADN